MHLVKTLSAGVALSALLIAAPSNALQAPEIPSSWSLVLQVQASVGDAEAALNNALAKLEEAKAAGADTAEFEAAVKQASADLAAAQAAQEAEAAKAAEAAAAAKAAEDEAAAQAAKEAEAAKAAEDAAAAKAAEEAAAAQAAQEAEAAKTAEAAAAAKAAEDEAAAQAAKDAEAAKAAEDAAAAKAAEDAAAAQAAKDAEAAKAAEDAAAAKAAEDAAAGQAAKDAEAAKAAEDAAAAKAAEDAAAGQAAKDAEAAKAAEDAAAAKAAEDAAAGQAAKDAEAAKAAEDAAAAKAAGDAAAGQAAKDAEAAKAAEDAAAAQAVKEAEAAKAALEAAAAAQAAEDAAAKAAQEAEAAKAVGDAAAIKAAEEAAAKAAQEAEAAKAAEAAAAAKAAEEAAAKAAQDAAAQAAGAQNPPVVAAPEPVMEPLPDALKEEAAPVLDSAKEELPPAPPPAPGQSQPKPAAVPADPAAPPPVDDAAARIDLVPVTVAPVREEKGERITAFPEAPLPPEQQILKTIGDRIIFSINGLNLVEAPENPRLVRDGDEVIIEQLPRGRTRETIVRANGVQVVTIKNRWGDVIQRSRVLPDGREVILAYTPEYDREEYVEWRDPVYDLPPLQLRVPVREYILDARLVEDEDQGEEVYYNFLDQPPVERVERTYSVQDVKRSARVRDKARRVEMGNITFGFGSADIEEGQIEKLQGLADAMLKLIKKNPAETFLIEGHTDAVGSDTANLALSDKRAESVATALGNVFDVPSENLTTQGYGERYLKVKTGDKEPLNRRVVFRRITPLITPVASAK